MSQNESIYFFNKFSSSHKLGDVKAGFGVVVLYDYNNFLMKTGLQFLNGTTTYIKLNCWKP